jgi:hypothetical protein
MTLKYNITCPILSCWKPTSLGLIKWSLELKTNHSHLLQDSLSTAPPPDGKRGSVIVSRHFQSYFRCLILFPFIKDALNASRRDRGNVKDIINERNNWVPDISLVIRTGVTVYWTDTCSEHSSSRVLNASSRKATLCYSVLQTIFHNTYARWCLEHAEIIIHTQASCRVLLFRQYHWMR